MLRPALYLLLSLLLAGCPDQQSAEFKEAKEEATKGHCIDQFSLGLSYYNGSRGAPIDKQQAAFWFHKAADQGLSAAHSILAEMYDKGEGVPKDDSQAIFWYRKAALAGIDSAQFNLARKYRLGEGVPKNYVEAFLWYRQAAERGHAKSGFELGEMYLKGEGNRVNQIEAYAWFNLFSPSLNEAKSARDSLEKDMTPEAVTIAQARSKELQKSLDEYRALMARTREPQKYIDESKAAEK